MPLTNGFQLQSNPFSVQERSLSFNKIECIVNELQFCINSISTWKCIKEKHEMEQAASTYCIFQLICPINSQDT